MRSIQLIPRQVLPRDATAFKGKVHQLFAELFWRRLIISLWNGPRHRHRFVIFSVAISSVSDYLGGTKKIESVSARIIEYSRIALEMVASLQGFFKKKRSCLFEVCLGLIVSFLNWKLAQLVWVSSLDLFSAWTLIFQDSSFSLIPPIKQCLLTAIILQSIFSQFLFSWRRIGLRFERQKPICVWFNEKTHIPKWSIIRSGHQ